MPKPFLNIQHKIYIRGHYRNKASSAMARFFGCSKSVVQKYMRQAGLNVSVERQRWFRSQGMKGRTIFTRAMDKILIAQYKDVPGKELARQLGVSSTCLYKRMEQLNLSVPKKILEQRKRNTQFKKGQEAHNKGKKMADFLSPKAMKKLKKTQFKKGHTPHNTLEGNGAIRVRLDSKTGRPYKYLKLADADWQLLQRVNYEKAYGPIPEGSLVSFKDGDTMNCNPKNLECITKAENARRNLAAYRKLPPELKKGIKLKNRITKLIQEQNEK